MPESTNVTAIGNLTRDPDLRFTNAGRAVAAFGIACNRRYQVNGEWTEQTSFFNVTAWATLGENASASLHKGDRVFVTGRLEQRSFTDKAGNERTAVEIIADEIGPSLRWATAEIQKIDRETVTRPAAPKGESDHYNEEPF